MSQKNIPTDEQLLNSIQKGDRKAFRLLFDRYYKILLGTAINVLKDVESAKDAVQEVFLQLWKNRETLKITSSIPAYLKRGVINRSLNQIKSRSRFTSEETILEHHSGQPDAQKNLEAEDLKKVINEALAQLPERCRLVYILKRQEGLSLKEIAEKLDISPKTAENQMTKALKVLKEAALPFLKKVKNK